jgi:flagellar hook protein FlgE
MSLYGSLYAGVSGLRGQSNKIGQISDNISNVNTVGYKGNRASFESLVTTAASVSQFSPGGVLGGSQQLVSKQGLLQSTDSATDIAISGNGFFVVNTQSDGAGSVQYTRAGSFIQDKTGNFRNSAGFYLQAWPLDREGRLPGEAGNLNTVSSANLASLTTVNVKNLTGAAAATSRVQVGANLNAAQGIYPGAAGTLSPDVQHVENVGIKAKDIIVPGGPNSLTRGDRFTVLTGTGLSYTYRYSGFVVGRDVTTTGAGNIGDNGQAVLASPTTLTSSAISLPTTGTIGTNGTTVTINTTAEHGLKNGDAVTLAGIVGTAGAINGIPVTEINGTHIVTVTGTNTYTITSTTSGTVGTANEASATATVLPFVSTASSKVVNVRQAAHGLKDGQVVTLAGNTGGFAGIPAGDLNGTFIVDVIDADHYKITVATTAGATPSAGGAGTVQATSRLSTTGNIFDASNATTPFLSTTGTSSFSSAALKFTITTGGVTSTFTYTSASPTASLGQFNNLTNLAEAINTVSGLSARVSGGRLYVGATDANAAISFANSKDTGTEGPPVQWGLDWVRELGLQNLEVGTDRFSNMQGLAALVNTSAGLTATLTNPLSAASLTINVNDPLGTVTFTDHPAASAVTLADTPFTMTADSETVVVTVPSTAGYVNGDVVDLGTLSGGPFNGISAANLSGKFAITVLSATTFAIRAKNGDTASSSVTNPAGPVSPSNISMMPPTNYGSIVAEFGIGGTPSLNGVTYTAKTTGAIGPAYDPTSSTKNIAGGKIVAQFSRPIRVYDSQGAGHDLTMSFIKSAVNTWQVEIYAANPAEVTTSRPNGQIATGSVSFNGDGSLQSVSAGLLSADVTWTNGSSSTTLGFDWGTAGAPFGTPNTTAIGKTDGLSQFNSAYRVNFVNQNGAPVGDLTGVSITDEGLIVASYSNGQTQALFRVPLADFANPDQLQTSSGNVFAQSANSGEVNLRQPGSSGVGKLAASSLEQSNVELADQLTDMIVAQRAYQANTKVISTTDQLLSQLNDILR